MPVIQKKVTIAAGGTVENALSGSAFEFARSNQLTSVGIVASVAGVFGTYQSGADVVLEESELAVKTNFPVIPDDMYYSDVAVQGDRQVVRLRNPTAGSVDVRVLMQVTQLR